MKEWKYSLWKREGRRWILVSEHETVEEAEEALQSLKCGAVIDRASIDCRAARGRITAAQGLELTRAVRAWWAKRVGDIAVPLCCNDVRIGTLTYDFVGGHIDIVLDALPVLSERLSAQLPIDADPPAEPPAPAPCDRCAEAAEIMRDLEEAIRESYRGSLTEVRHQTAPLRMMRWMRSAP